MQICRSSNGNLPNLWLVRAPVNGRHSFLGCDVTMKDWQKKYYDYLESEEWLRKKRLIVARDDNRCVRCGKTWRHGPLMVHHITYDRVFNEIPADLETLCYRCHAKHHNMPIKGEPNSLGVIFNQAFLGHGYGN